MDSDDAKELDDLRKAVGHVSLLVQLGRAVIAMRDAQRHAPSVAHSINDYIAAKDEAFRLVSEWEEAHPHGR